MERYIGVENDVYVASYCIFAIQKTGIHLTLWPKWDCNVFFWSNQIPQILQAFANVEDGGRKCVRFDDPDIERVRR